MIPLAAWIQQGGMALGYAGVAALCLAGLFLSILSLSGTWLVLGGALLAAWLPGPFPGPGTLVFFAVLCALVEGGEFLAGSWGVTRRGGSAAAGWAALLGGLLGMVLGVIIPVPLIGSFLGMCIGSFALVYAVERRRFRQAGPAAHIAWGAVWARLAVLLVKVLVTLGMTAWLAAGLWRAG